MANAQQQGPQWPFWLLVTPPTHNHNTAAHHRAVSLHQASGVVTPQQRETGQVPPRSGSAGTRPVLGRPSHRPPCSKFEQQQTAEEAAALVVLCARKHRRRARLLTLISQHTRTKANHHLELTKRFEGGVASACASGAPPVRLRCASGAPPVRLRCASGAPPLPPACLTHLATLRVRRGVRAARLSLATVAVVVVDAPQPQQPSTVRAQPMTVVMRAFRLCYCGGIVTRNDCGGNTERLRR